MVHELAGYCRVEVDGESDFPKQGQTGLTRTEGSREAEKQRSREAEKQRSGDKPRSREAEKPKPSTKQGLEERRASTYSKKTQESQSDFYKRKCCLQRREGSDTKKTWETRRMWPKPSACSFQHVLCCWLHVWNYCRCWSTACALQACALGVVLFLRLGEFLGFVPAQHFRLQTNCALDIFEHRALFLVAAPRKTGRALRGWGGGVITFVSSGSCEH